MGFKLCTFTFSWFCRLSRICSFFHIFLKSQIDVAFICLTVRAVCVLQTKAGFVTFSNLGPIEGQQIIVGEHLNAMVVPVDWMRMAKINTQRERKWNTERSLLNLLLFLFKFFPTFSCEKKVYAYIRCRLCKPSCIFAKASNTQWQQL